MAKDIIQLDAAKLTGPRAFFTDLDPGINPIIPDGVEKPPVRRAIEYLKKLRKF